jgi:hypothetical protein
MEDFKNSVIELGKTYKELKNIINDDNFTFQQFLDYYTGSDINYNDEEDLEDE